MERLAPDLAQMQRTPLHEAHVDALRKAGQIVEFEEGKIIGDIGDPMTHFHYILEGQVDVLDAQTRKPFLPHSIGPTQFLGDIVNERSKLTRFQRLNLTHLLWRKAPRRAALT